MEGESLVKVSQVGRWEDGGRLWEVVVQGGGRMVGGCDARSTLAT